MKLNEIKCVLTTEEKLDMVDYIIGITAEGYGSYTCTIMHMYLIKHNVLLNRAADSLGVSKEDLDRIIFGGGVNICPITERHRVKIEAYDMGSECIREKDDTRTNIKLRLFLPELLKYEPKVLALGGGFWLPSCEPELDPRLKALKEIREKLRKQIQNNQLNKENHD